MSIQTQIERIAAEVTTQEDLIQQIQTALQGKAAGVTPEDLNDVLTEQEALIAELKESLRGKASGGGGEDVTAETDAYTEKLEALETAITALETELEGKASGGGTVETCTVKVEYRDADFGGIVIGPNAAIYFSTVHPDSSIQPVVLQSGVDFDFSEGAWGSQSVLVTIESVIKNSILTIVDNANITYTDAVGEVICDKNTAARVFLINQNDYITLS